MKTLEVTISITLQVPDTEDKTYDCLMAVDRAKTLLNDMPGYQLLRNDRSTYGDPLVQITKLKSTSQGWVADLGNLQPPPLHIDIPIEGEAAQRDLRPGT